MKITVLGTGMVGKAHASRLVELGYDVAMGTQDVQKTQSDNPQYSEWHAQNDKVKLLNLADASDYGEIIINALSGNAALRALTDLKDKVGNKILIDITNPLDFSKGMPPTLFVSNSDSLGEQIQKALPEAKVVKTLNTVTAEIQVKPGSLAEADHDVFLSGDDEEAKSEATKLLKAYGWKNIHDLGDISTARGTEMYLPLWLRLMGSLGKMNFNIKVVNE